MRSCDNGVDVRAEVEARPDRVKTTGETNGTKRARNSVAKKVRRETLIPARSPTQSPSG